MHATMYSSWKCFLLMSLQKSSQNDTTLTDTLPHSNRVSPTLAKTKIHSNIINIITQHPHLKIVVIAPLPCTTQEITICFINESPRKDTIIQRKMSFIEKYTKKYYPTMFVFCIAWWDLSREKPFLLRDIRMYTRDYLRINPISCYYISQDDKQSH